MLPVFLPITIATVASADSSPAVLALVERSEAARLAGRLDEALRTLDTGAALVSPSASPVDRLRVRLQRARCVYYRSSLAGSPHDAVIADLKAIAAEAAGVGSDRLLADAKDQLGLAIYARDFRASDQKEARALFEEALGLRRAAADRRGIAESLFHVALTWENKKDATPADKARSRALHEESLAAAEAGGFEVEAAYAVRHVAGHKQDAGDLDGALAGFERSLALREKAGYAIYLAPALLAVGDVWKDKGDAAKAREYFGRARAEADRIGAARFQRMADEALASLPSPAPRR
jgi:tetratricopeptide (TPR) repeat protein